MNIRPLLFCIPALVMVALPARGALLWTVGTDDTQWNFTQAAPGNGGGANATFVQEGGGINALPGNPANPEMDQQSDNDYYFAGTYTTHIATNGNYALLTNTTVAANEESVERAFGGDDLAKRYHFNVPATYGPNDRITVTFDALNLDTSGTDPRFGVEILINGNLVRPEEIIRAAQFNVDYTSTPKRLSEVGVVTGPGADNIVTLRGISYNGSGGGNWMGIDYVKVDIDNTVLYITNFTATPASTQPGASTTLSWSVDPTATVSINQGVGDVTPVTTNGSGSIIVNPLATTIYTLSATVGTTVQTRNVTVTVAPFIASFTTSDAMLRPGESATLGWTINSAVVAGASLSINQGVGPVTAPGGTGSTVVTPATNTVYTLSALYNGVTQTANVTVNATPWFVVFEAGLDNAANTEFSHEVAADDDYYFAGDYTSAGGPNQAADESLNDDTNTNTPAGRTGNPAIGFERALAESDPHQNIWFIPNPVHVNPTARHRITVDVLSVGSGGGGTQSHNLEISLNGTLLRTENAIPGARLIQFEVGGITSGLRTGTNSLTVRRTGGTFAGFVVLDYVMMEFMPGTAPTITGITDDPILGTHTIAWTSQTARTYRIQKSSDAGASWQDLAGGFPTGGALSTSLFYEDRATPHTAPRPDYRVLQE